MGIPIIGDIINVVGDIAGKFIKDKDKVEAFKHEMAMTLPKMDLAQMEVNKVEAAHSSIFVAGWRPMVGWICATALGLNYLALPLGRWACAIWLPEIELPMLEQGELMTLLMGMLGMGTLRTYEKRSGVARKNLEQ